MMQSRSEREYVGAVIDMARVSKLLGRHVVGSPQGNSGSRVDR